MGQGSYESRVIEAVTEYVRARYGDSFAVVGIALQLEDDDGTKVSAKLCPAAWWSAQYRAGRLGGGGVVGREEPPLAREVAGGLPRRGPVLEDKIVEALAAAAHPTKGVVLAMQCGVEYGSYFRSKLSEMQQGVTPRVVRADFGDREGYWLASRPVPLVEEGDPDDETVVN